MLIKLEGADAALKALRQMEPLTAREVGKEITGVGKMIVARTNAPGIAMTNWRTTAAAQPYRGSRQGSGGWPAYDIGKARSARRGMNVTVSHSSAAGAIYEYAGVRNINGVSPAGAGFISQLPPLSRLSKGPAGRYLRRGLASVYPQALDRIEMAANKAADAVNRLMP
jgi:hypothetical protein